MAVCSDIALSRLKIKSQIGASTHRDGFRRRVELFKLPTLKMYITNNRRREPIVGSNKGSCLLVIDVCSVSMHVTHPR